MGLIESLETAIATSRRNYAELVSLTDQLITEQQQQGQLKAVVIGPRLKHNAGSCEALKPWGIRCPWQIGPSWPRLDKQRC